MDLTLLLLRVLLTLLLYAFLGGVLLFLWRGLRQSAGTQVLYQPSGRLVVVEVGEADVEVGQGFPLQEVTSLGRVPANTIVLPDPFTSSHHALLAWREGRWWLEDQGSKNGTTLNGEEVTRPTIVSAGDLIGVGQVILRLEVA